MALAVRTTAFSGVMAARAAALRDTKRGRSGDPNRREHTGTAALTTVPSLSEHIEYATTPRR